MCPVNKNTEQILELAREEETGTRILPGKIGLFVRLFAITMSLFQLYTGLFGELPGYQQLSVHLFFALILCFIYFPISKRSSRNSLSTSDVILAFVGGSAAIYVFANYNHWANAAGDKALYDIVIGGVLMLVVLEATRRSVSPALSIITMGFLCYAYLGPYIPGELAHRGFNVSRIIDHIFMTGEGLWSIPLRVSSTFIFLFVLFGAMMERTGAGQYLINLSFACVGRFRGGPAKAAVVASAAMGSISGSSIANTATTGAMTIPLMKRIGYAPHVAGAIEVAASTNGQLMPPIMGAAAFIMAEMIGVSYLEVVKAALIPALLSYTAIFSIVHLEAVKHDLRSMPKDEIPAFWRTLLPGIHFLIPLAVLVFMLLILFWTPSTSASWSIIAGALVAIGNNMLRARNFSKTTELNLAFSDPIFKKYQIHPKGFILRQVKEELLGTLEVGARNMVGVAAACACCGMIIGVVTLTGLGLKMAAFITYLAGGKLFLTLLYTALACIILGIGLPTAPTYIIMASMAVPSITSLNIDMNLGIPIMAMHLFVFYYGIVADDTPPVGLCAYAAAGIAGADPIKTGWKSFRLDLAAFTLPFMYIYNPKLLMYNTNWAELLYILPISIVGMYCWAIFIQGFFLIKTFWWERFLFLIIAFILVNPSGIVIANIHLSPHIANLLAIAMFAAEFLWQRYRKGIDKVFDESLEVVS